MAATDTSIKAALDGHADWHPAANALVDHLIAEGECFSSGEVARWMRIHRPDLRFSVPTLGEHVRDLYYAGSMPQYPDDGYGVPMPPTQVPRTTQGLCRTPAGIQVFVYCPEAQKGFAHNFEVDIPTPGGAATVYPNPPPVQTQPASGAPTIQITGASNVPLVALKATVQQDRRLQVPRSAFEAFVHFCGIPMKGGDPVYVLIEADKAVITLADPGNGAKPYDLTRDRGRVSFPAMPGTQPFEPGDVFMVNIAPAGLTVDLTLKVPA